jgi:hypothetical protein
VLPEGYRDPTPEQVDSAEATAAIAALVAWGSAMLAAINVEVDLPLTDEVVAGLGPAMPDCGSSVESGPGRLRRRGPLSLTT